MKNNERIWNLQDQISKHKARGTADRERFTQEIKTIISNAK
jgi:hypothetical protein